MTQHLRPISTISAGAWTASATTLHGDTDEGMDSPDDDGSYAEVDVDASDMELLLAPGVDPVSADAHQLQWRARRKYPWIQPAELTVSLYQGAALIATSTSYHVQTYSDGTYTLSAAEANAISDYTDLRIRVRLAIPIGSAHVHFTACELDVPSLTIHAGQRGTLLAPSVDGEVAQPIARGELHDCG